MFVMQNKIKKYLMKKIHYRPVNLKTFFLAKQPIVKGKFGSEPMENLDPNLDPSRSLHPNPRFRPEAPWRLDNDYDM